MMTLDPITATLPFLTRNMLAFQEGSTIGLRLTLRDIAFGVITITGATRTGVFTFTATGAGDGLLTDYNFNINDLPIWLSVTDKNNQIAQGETFAKLSLTINGDRVYTYCAGYISFTNDISWPIASTERHSSNRGEIAAPSGVDPAAGAEIVDTTEAYFNWKLKGVRFTLVASAQAATRTVSLVINISGSPMIVIAAARTQVANETRNYLFTAGNIPAVGAATGDIITPIPEGIIIPAGETIGTSTANIQTGDDFGAATYYRETEFI